LDVGFSSEEITEAQAEEIDEDTFDTKDEIGKSKMITDSIGRSRVVGSDTWIKGSGTKGTADISAIINGRSVKIEVKIGKDAQSKDQISYQKAVEDAGGIYYIAKDFESFWIWYLKEFES